MRVAYGKDTKSVEDWDQIAVIDVPDDLAWEDAEDYFVSGKWKELDVVLWEDVVQALVVALAYKHIDSDQIVDIVATVKDAVVNA